VLFATARGVAIIDPQTRAVVGTIDVGAQAFRLALFPSAPSIPNGAYFQLGSVQPVVSPGAIVSIFGSGLSRGTAQGSVPLPTSLLGASVFVNSLRAPLFYVSPQQINFQIPYELPAGRATIRVDRDGLPSTTQNLPAPVQSVSPGILTVNQVRTGPGIVVHADSNQLVSAESPARAGENLAIYAVGLGALQTPIASGAAASGPNETVTPVQVTIGGVRAALAYAGLTQGYPGLYQVNIQMPPGVRSGSAVAVVATVGGVASNPATLAVE